MPFREALKRVNVHNLLLNGDKKHQQFPRFPIRVDRGHIRAPDAVAGTKSMSKNMVVITDNDTYQMQMLTHC